MSDRNYSLLIAAYDDQDAASTGFNELKSVDDVKVVAAAVLARDSDGKVTVKEHGGRQLVYGTAAGAAVGVVVGLFAPPLLLSGVIGAGIGAGVGEIVKRHQEKEIGVDVEEWLPAGSSAVVAVIDDRYLDRVDKAFTKATKSVTKAVDKGDFNAVVKAVSKGDERVLAAIES